MKHITFKTRVKAFYLTICLTVLVILQAVAQTVSVNGTITDAKTNEMIVGATVKVKGGTTATVTDVNGRFKLNAAVGSTLQISYVGYTSLEVPAGQGKDLQIAISPTANDLNEVIVVGLGSQRKATLAGSIATVNAKTFEDRGPTNNPIANLQGQVPGVVVTRSSAQPGRESWNFQIRGAASVNNQDPLVVLDGVALNNNNALNSLNPADIESMSFLKDGSAAIYGARAAYGVVLITTKRGKSGAMNVQYDPSFSRKLLGLQPKLLRIKDWATGLSQALTNDRYGLEPNDFIWYHYAQFILKSNTNYLPVTAIPGYNGSLPPYPQNLQYNGLTVPGFGDVKDLPMFDTNMQEILWGAANSTQQNLSVSGGSEKSTYRLSLGYLNDGSQLQYGTNGNQRYTIRANNDYNFSNNVKLSTNIGIEKNDIKQPTLYSLGSYSALSNYSQPGIPAFTQSGKPYAWGTVQSPPGQLEYGGDNLEYNSRVLLNTTLSYNFLKHLNFTGTAGYNTWLQDNRVQTKQVQYYSYNDQFLVSTAPTNGGITPGGTNPGANYYRSNINNPYYNLIGRVTYNNVFNKDHDVTVMAGGSYERDEYDFIETRTYNLGNEDIPSLGLGLSSGTAGFVTNGETRNHYALGSYFSRATYAYKSKYILEGIARYDGSSKFIADRRWKLFYGLEGAWRISEESFIKKLHFFDNLKLRASYGTTGNQAGIGLYDYVQSLNIGASGNLIGSNIATSTTQTGTLVSLERTWEKVIKRNLAVDFGFLQNRLSGTFEIFRNSNNNMLIGITYPATLGIGAPKSNDGKLNVWGWDGVLTWKDNIGKLSYTLSANITDSQNKLVYYGGGSNIISSGYNAFVEGYPLNSYFGLKYAGKLQSEGEVNAYNAKYYNPGGVVNMIDLPIASALGNQPGKFTGLRPGDNAFEDVNGDGKLTRGTTIENPGDLVYLGTDQARYTFGFNIGLQWKGFDLYTIFQGVGKRAIFRSGSWRVPFGVVNQGVNDSYVGNVWSPENTDGFYPNLHSAQNGSINTYNYQASTWSIENGAYVRLKNLVIGYTLPVALLQKTKAIKKLRVYASGSDLWEATKIHDGWDPETTRLVAGNERFPFYRFVTLGANITF